MLPAQKDIEVPLLETLVDMGGEGVPRDIYPLVTKRFPNITEEGLLEVLRSGLSKWENRIQWAKQCLVLKGEIDRSRRGIWTITDKGRKRLLVSYR